MKRINRIVITVYDDENNETASKAIDRVIYLTPGDDVVVNARFSYGYDGFDSENFGAEPISQLWEDVHKSRFALKTILNVYKNLKRKSFLPKKLRNILNIYAETYG